jgi:hypothetical protein
MMVAHVSAAVTPVLYVRRCNQSVAESLAAGPSVGAFGIRDANRGNVATPTGDHEGVEVVAAEAPRGD